MRRGRKPDATGRSDGGGQHVRLHHWMLESAAYRSLPVGARALLVELMAFYNGRNNGELFLSLREAAKRTGQGKDAAARGLRELEDRGFIRTAQPGGFTRKDRHATKWILTEFPIGTEMVGTRDFMRWSAPPKIQNTVALQGQSVPETRQGVSFQGQHPHRKAISGVWCP